MIITIENNNKALPFIVSHFHPSLIFVYKARSPPVKLNTDIGSTRLGYGLSCKFETRMEAIRDKQTSLLLIGNNYGGKNICNVFSLLSVL